MYFRCREKNNINILPPCTSQASRSQFEEFEIMYIHVNTIHNSTIRQGKMFILSVSANDHMIKRTPKKKRKETWKESTIIRCCLTDIHLS